MANTSENELYESFLSENRVRINTYLNWALWFCALTGPAIAIGIFFGVFTNVTYVTCIILTILIVILALIHKFFVRRYPDAIITSIYSFFVLNILLIYMLDYHIYIKITWFLVPLLSLVFCSYRIYFASLAITYGTMLIALYMTAPFYASQRADTSSFMQYFSNAMAGNTIEMLIMGMAGVGILRTTHRYTRELFEKYNNIKDREVMVRDSINTLKSMAGIYDRVNLINFSTMTEVSLQDKSAGTETFDITDSTHTHMVNELRKSISPDHIDAFWEFTELTTLRDRLKDKKSIYSEFINIFTGWFRAQYIVVEKDDNGAPVKIIFTVQDIEQDKRRESQLIKMAHTDELTRLYNRRRYDEEIQSYREKGLDEGFTLLSADVNGLKITNDTKGHAAGDELIKGAADCLHTSIMPYGKVFRTGGDEFMAIVHIKNHTDLCDAITARTGIWHGEFSDHLSISLGCASHEEFPDATIDELEHISDSRMYENKEHYYRQAGIDRRKK